MTQLPNVTLLTLIKKIQFKNDKMFRFLLSTIKKAFNNSRRQWKSIFHRRTQIIESKNDFHKEVKR